MLPTRIPQHPASLLALSCALASCAPTDSPATERHSGQLANTFQVSGSTDGAPASCSSTAITATLAAWVRALNEGDQQSAAALFGIERPGTPFAWFSFADTAAAMNITVRTSADSLAKGFANMEVADVEIRAVDIVAWVPERESVALLLFFEYSATGDAAEPDSSERRVGFGKAEYHCPSESFLVMSIGRMPEDAWRELYAVHLGRDA